MEDLTAQIPSNEKSCQTDELEEKAPVLRPEHLNQMPEEPEMFEKLAVFIRCLRDAATMVLNSVTFCDRICLSMAYLKMSVD
ncbi:zinc finger protein 800b isoform X1 [Tachysurus ichikawai]